ncbi:histidine phosphatase family protein [Shouchella shacheensis]|uniref:histidine phosphatase family protein n=1 Tax=Shouchella shacheensis TaxID=1649580 RepID=UPI00074048B8|nr:histidine phosphatase family protein [Shouchella shacheensis]
MNLYIVRHGESEGNRSKKIQGTMDFPLTDLGHEQAGAVASFCQELDIEYVYSSDLKRASTTAEAIAKEFGQRVHRWEALREVHLGPMQGLTREEIAEKFPETKEKPLITSGLPGTETNEALTERSHSVLRQLKKAHAHDNVAIVSHGGFISCLLMYILVGENWASYERPFMIGNTSVTHLEWRKREDRYLLHYTNRTAHLDSIRTEINVKHGLL